MSQSVAAFIVQRRPKEQRDILSEKEKKFNIDFWKLILPINYSPPTKVNKRKREKLHGKKSPEPETPFTCGASAQKHKDASLVGSELIIEIMNDF